MDKSWAIIDMPKYGGAFVSRHRMTDEEINKIMARYGALNIDLYKDFRVNYVGNVIIGVYKTNDKEHAIKIAECLNNGGSLADVLAMRGNK